MIPEWFGSDLIETKAKAFGVYLSLLKCRFVSGWWHNVIKRIHIDSIRREIFRLVDTGLNEALKASELFLNMLDEREPKDSNYIKRILDNIEIFYYERFRDACYNYFKGVDDSVREPIKNFLRDVKMGRIKVWERTTMGSVKMMYPPDTPSLVNLYWKKFRIDWRKVVEELTRSGIVIFQGSMVPASFLEFSFINSL